MIEGSRSTSDDSGPQGQIRTVLARGLSISRLVNDLESLADSVAARRSGGIKSAAAAMHVFVEAGLTSFDMSSTDGVAEKAAGVFGRRAERLTTWAPAPDAATPEHARSAVEGALRRLDADAIDLFQFRAPSFAGPGWFDTLSSLHDLKRAGLVRHLGVADFDTAHLRIAVRSGLEIASNRVSFSLLDPRASGAMADFCALNGVALLASCPLLGGFLGEAWLGRPEPEWSRLKGGPLARHGRFIRAAGGWESFQQLLRRVDEVATRHRVSIATVALRAILDEPGVGAAIVDTPPSGEKGLVDLANVFTLNLDDADWLTLARGRKYLRPIPGDCGDEYRRPPYLAGADVEALARAAPPPYQVKPASRGRTAIVPAGSRDLVAGSALAHRLDDRLWVSGMTASHGDTTLGGTDAAAQFHFAIDRVEGALLSLGSTLGDVVRTRVTIRNLDDAPAVSHAHGERFRGVLPASSLFRADLEDHEALVSVEVEAVASGE